MHRLEVPMPNVLPFKIGTFQGYGPEAYADFPHRHTFYEIVHVTAGSGTHVVELERHPLEPPHLGVVAPGQVHHWEGVSGLEGTVILFTEHFLVEYADDREVLGRLAAERPWLGLDGAAEVWAGRLVGELQEEFRRGAEGFATVLRALLHILVVRAARLAGPFVPEGGAGARSVGVATGFGRLLAGGDPAGWSVRGCADALGVSAGYLAEAVKAATGRTPGELIREARVGEAKRLLACTDLTVRQVALRTGMSDPAYFCRFFRRETGVSPGDFRRGVDVGGMREGW
ncbi:helix-turn-helix transcriptional regulator [Streptomyces lichenis]|uniref:helix-turn-helix transcriptional regulator n=1 Tax=Streptomyces lichenis TaxID=2306967 RepID=UPI0024A70AD0|nr:AraC family transcriptional regulator [Streptomyces lichenis]